MSSLFLGLHFFYEIWFLVECRTRELPVLAGLLALGSFCLCPPIPHLPCLPMLMIPMSTTAPGFCAAAGTWNSGPLACALPTESSPQTYSSLLSFHYFYLILCVCECCLHVYVCVAWCLRRSEEKSGSPGTGVVCS